MNRLLRLRDAAAQVGVNKSHIYNLMRDHGFPTPIKIGAASRWSEQEVQAWIEARIAQARSSSADSLSVA